MKKYIYTKALYITGISVCVLTARAQGQHETCCRTLTYTDFLEQVSNHNLEYAAEKLNIVVRALKLLPPTSITTRSYP